MGNTTSRYRKESPSQTGKSNSPERTQSDSVITTSLRNLRHDLELIIEIAYDLLDVLISMKILTEQQVERILSKRITSEKISQLLDYVIEMSLDQQRQFLKALEKNQQLHVVAYVQGDGSSEQNLPLFASEVQIGLLDKHRSMLIDSLDSSNGLVDELFSVQCINDRQKQVIEALKNESEKNERILAILRRKSVADFDSFIGCLKKTKQHQIVSLLAPDVANNEIPLSEEKRSRIRRNYSVLVELIDSKGGLLQHLMSLEGLTWRQKISIESLYSQMGRNQRLLDMIQRGSESDFSKFLVCLLETRQVPVYRLLSEDSAVPRIQAKLENAEDVEHLEKCIVEQIMTLLSQISDDRRQEVRDEVNRRFEELHSRNIELFAAATGCSVDLYFFCRSLSGLHFLYELYSNGRLKSLIEDLFNLLLENLQMAEAKISKLLWDMANYVNCLQHLSLLAGLSVLPIVYQLAQQASSPLKEYAPFNADTHLILFELKEIILLKAVGELFRVINVTMPRAEVYAVVTFCSVSSSWHQLFTSRLYNRGVLRRYFKHVCHPFKCNPTLSQQIEGCSPVWGAAESNGKLYIARGQLRTIEVYVSKPPFNRLEDISLPGTGTALIQDIAVCCSTSQLYVADGGSPGAVWRVDLSGCKPASEFASTEKPSHSLSVYSGHLLIVPCDGNTLSVYGDSGSVLIHVELPHHMKAQHAVETSDNTYIVSHRSLAFGMRSSHSGVSELDASGQVVRSFSCEHNDLGAIQFNMPYYIALDGSDHVIVADHYNKRIVLLKSDLQLRRVLISSVDEQPFRLCVSRDSQLNDTYLYVAYALSPIMNVFKLK